jgi:K(+)-stimulated pyrophosphate-energized sodium pump
MAWHDMNDEETKTARQIMADLDAVGNTTKAITKGVAIASAVIAAVSLFGSYIADVGRVQAQLGQTVMSAIRVSDTKVFVGLLLGGALPWLFSSLSIRAVSRAAGKIVEEVRRQFKIPGIMEGTKQPDYAEVVGISTSSGDNIRVDAFGYRPGSAGGSPRRFPGRHHPFGPVVGSVDV